MRTGLTGASRPVWATTGQQPSSRSLTDRLPSDRRCWDARQVTLSFGDLELDPSVFELRRHGVRVPLEPQAFDVLVYLINHRDRVVSKEELLDQVWGGRFVSHTAVTRRVKQVRRAVGDDGGTQPVIRTVPGRGYRFAARTVDHEGPAAPYPDGRIPPGAAAHARVTGIGHQVAGREEARPQSPPLVGRVEERAALSVALDRALAGDGHTILIGGEPGIGKSVLMSDLVARARSRGATVLTGRAIASGGPYRPLTEALMSPWRAGLIDDPEGLSPFRNALGRVLPGWSGSAPAEPGVDPVIMVGEGLLRILLGFQTQGCVLALEDLHDADADTLAALDYLAASVGNLSVLIVATFRDWPRPPGLEHLLAASHTTRMSLERLPDSDVRELVDSFRSLPSATRDQVVLHAEGLPVVVADLVDSAAQHEEPSDGWTLPDTFAALIDARMAALTGQERQLLGAAAVLEPTPDWDLVPRIAGVEPTDAVTGLRHALEVHLLVADRDGLRWRHGLIRRAVWAALLPPQRRALCLTAADLLLQEGSRDASAAAAELLLTAGQSGRAADVLVGLARQALQSGALRTAGDLLARASATGQRPAAIAIARVELMMLEGRAADALTVGASSVDIARGDEHAELCLQLAQAAIEAGDWTAAADWVGRAGRPGEPRSLVMLADSAHGAGRVAEARALAETAVARARSGQPPSLLAEALCVAARINRLDRVGAAREQFQEAAQIASEFGLKPWRVTALFGLGTVALLDDDASSLVHARDAALEIGLLGQAARAEVLLADHQLVCDGPAGLDVAAARLGEYGGLLVMPMLVHFSAILSATRAALLGDVEAMQRHLGALSAAGVPLDHQAQISGVRALAALADHDIETAAALLDATIRPLLDHGSAAPIVQFGLWAVVSARVGDQDRDLRSRLDAHPALRRRTNQGALHYADAILAGRVGDARMAQAEFDTGERLLAPVGWWRRFVRLIVVEAAVLDGWGDPVPLLRADVATYEQAGEAALAKIGRELLRRAGVPNRRGRGSSDVPPALRAAGLTSRELDVLRLVEAGLSNRVISERLFLSPRTVETHVGNLLAKAGVANRQELRVWSRSLTP